MTVPTAWGGDGEPGPAPGAAALLAAAQACRETARVAFGYTARGGARTDREVEPHWLVLLGRCWYLVAWDLARHDWRTFRIDRMGPPRRPGRHFAPRRLPAPAPTRARTSATASRPSWRPSATSANRSDQAARLTRAAVVQLRFGLLEVSTSAFIPSGGWNSSGHEVQWCPRRRAET